MKSGFAILLLGLALGCGGGETTACTEADVKARSEQISSAMIEFAQSDPQRLEEIAERMREIGERYAETNDPEDACRAYTAVLEELGL
ncbi:MAG: hypothetical protein QNK05_08565 [Myxococcota bacterium]|nr:hypothetical protein [Myxococcota bacterium]